MTTPKDAFTCWSCESTMSKMFKNNGMTVCIKCEYDRTSRYNQSLEEQKGADPQSIIDALVEEAMKKKFKILDDFLKAYIASRIDEKDFIKKIPKLVLVHKKVDDIRDFKEGKFQTVEKYWFEIKRGRNRKKI